MMESLLAVFSVDALQSSHPVSAKIKHPSEISQIFDSISYSKGKFLKKSIKEERENVLFP
jgi:aminopeptidase N